MFNEMTTPSHSKMTLTYFTRSTSPKARKTSTDRGHSSDLGNSRVVVGRVSRISLDVVMEMVIPSLLSVEDANVILDGRHLIVNNKWIHADGILLRSVSLNRVGTLLRCKACCKWQPTHNSRQWCD